MKHIETYLKQEMRYKWFGKIYFTSKQIAELAIDEFKDDLIWYFTKYQNVEAEEKKWNL